MARCYSTTRQNIYISSIASRKNQKVGIAERTKTVISIMAGQSLVQQTLGEPTQSPTMFPHHTLTQCPILVDLMINKQLSRRNSSCSLLRDF